MTTDIHLTAADGFSLGAYVAEPTGTPRGALLVLQEIFGVNSHIREVADGYAAEGYLAIAPALFDRAEPGVVLGYAPDDLQRGIAIRAQCPSDKTQLDIQAALAHVKSAGKVGVIGYCWGGSLAWLSACSIDGFSAAIAYYGSMLPANAALAPRCPVMAHFGAKDHGIPLEGVERFRVAQPAVQVFVYDADHGFNCNQRGAFDATAAALARTRSLELLASTLG